MFGARLALVAVWVHLAVGVYGCTDDAEWDNGAGKRCDEYAAKYCSGGHLLVVTVVSTNSNEKSKCTVRAVEN